MIYWLSEIDTLIFSRVDAQVTSPHILLYRYALEARCLTAKKNQAYCYSAVHVLSITVVDDC